MEEEDDVTCGLEGGGDLDVCHDQRLVWTREETGHAYRDDGEDQVQEVQDEQDAVHRRRGQNSVGVSENGLTRSMRCLYAVSE